MNNESSSASHERPDDAPARPSDQELAQRAQLGELTALDALVLRHQSSIASLLWKFTRTRADLDDLVQETFLRVVRSLGQWKPDRPFEHWLRRIAVNTGRDYCRRQSVRRRWLSEPSTTDNDAVPQPEAVDPGSDPAARAAASEAKEILAQLPPDDRALLTLFHLDGWDLPGIARDFGWTHTATKLRAWRARQRLRALLEEHF